ncbi:MAG: NAD(P)-dependent oxidoreductase [Methylocella sp.]
MKLLLFGATGGTGRELIRQALGQGHSVTAFLRDPARLGIEPSKVEIAQGDVSNRRAVEDAAHAQDAALRALGAASPFKRNPALTIGMHNIVMALEAARVRRFIHLSGDTVHEARAHHNFLRRRVIIPLFLNATATDHEIDESMIRQTQSLGRHDFPRPRPPPTAGCRITDLRKRYPLPGSETPGPAGIARISRRKPRRRTREIIPRQDRRRHGNPPRACHL